MDIKLWQTAMIQTMRDMLPSLARMTDRQVITKVGKERFEEALEQTVDYLENACGTKLTINQMGAVCAQVYRCLSTYVRDNMGLPVTVKTFIDNISLLAHSVDEAYPGYARAGILLAVISPSALPEPVARLPIRLAS